MVGWDLGGAHIKLAVLRPDGEIENVAQVPCELWRGIDRLADALDRLAGERPRAALHAVTMTGELVDLFADRRSGVVEIVESFVRAMGSSDVLLFAGEGFVAASQARASWGRIASANWLATASTVAQLVPQALVIDAGSTTTDIAVVAAGRVRAQGYDDRTRLVQEELVYTGVVRTPVMAVAAHVPFGGEWVGVMAEHFATMADAYRITGELDPQFDQAATADGRGKSREESMRRLARMIGCDLEQAPMQAWERLAHWLTQQQARLVQRACDRQCSRELLDGAAPVVGLGVGAFLAARSAAALGRAYVDYAALAGIAPPWRAAVNVCGPAYAVARLALTGPSLLTEEGSTS
jgi:probable H4MPT-linked C1 transfer pathway protein